MKHAPVADAMERLILIAMADAADSDGCNSYRAYRTHMLIAKDVSESTIRRHQRAMQARGLIRPDTTPPPGRYLKIPKNRRPPRWEICIPYSWWSDDQRAEIQRERDDHGLPPLTPESRPQLLPAPPKRTRSDKGKPNPNRRRKAARGGDADQREEARGVSVTPQEPELRGVTETAPGVSQRQPQGCLEDTQPSFVDLPGEPSSSSSPSVPAACAREQQEEEEVADAGKTTTVADALAVVDAAAATWGGRHSLPTAQERLRLAERVRGAMIKGATRVGVHTALTRDLGRVDSAVAVVMFRTGADGWAEMPTQAPAMSTSTTQLPPKCDDCDSQRQIELLTGAVMRCPTCHPLAQGADETVRDEAIRCNRCRGELFAAGGRCPVCDAEEPMDEREREQLAAVLTRFAVVPDGERDVAGRLPLRKGAAG
ncbi:hypothetical protein [Actinomadura xylanilytica]|uniref:hypothetical protein n=1 Tax=Actinomadura xylanilytica TaxID=887459 RepID=UPI00255AA8B6|nr:hypothetical protein [Actinomadura xylanilytica]MDL4777865.1 hypothetical protein [Actinomadura xylanilytica]